MISPERFTRYQASVGANTTTEVTVTASGTAHVKGSWTAIMIANFDVYMIGLRLRGSTLATTYTGQLLDIGYDPAGGTTYTVVIPNILAGGVADENATRGRIFYCPVFIPKGSQIAARIQAAIISDTLLVGAVLLGGHNRSAMHRHRGAVKDYGTNTVDSGGTDMGLAGAAFTKQAWIQLGADTTRRHSGLVATVAVAGAEIGSGRAEIDIGIDPTGGTSYTVVLPDIYLGADNTEAISLWEAGTAALLDIDIPLGASIAARHAVSAQAIDEIDVAVYAF